MKPALMPLLCAAAAGGLWKNHKQGVTGRRKVPRSASSGVGAPIVAQGGSGGGSAANRGGNVDSELLQLLRAEAAAMEEQSEDNEVEEQSGGAEVEEQSEGVEVLMMGRDKPAALKSEDNEDEACGAAAVEAAAPA